MESQPLGRGAKIAAIAIIFAFSTGMLALCIPLVSITQTGLILPLVVILGAFSSTMVVWLSSDPQNYKISELIEEIRILQQRVTTLETIAKIDDLSVPKHLEVANQDALDILPSRIVE